MSRFINKIRKKLRIDKCPDSTMILVAMIPLVVGNIGPGAGEGSRLAVGATILGGMVISTFFTLYVTPTMYLTLAKNTKRIDAVDIELDNQLS